MYAMLYARGGVMTNRHASAANPVAPVASVELDRLARQVAALRLNWSDPRAYYEMRSDLAARLRRLARWARDAEAQLNGL